MEKNEALERAVLFGNIGKAAELCKPSAFTAIALGIACRFCGLNMVKALVERGASFKCSDEWNVDKGIVNAYRGSDPDYSLMLFDNTVFVDGIYKTEIEPTILPISERLKISEYLLDNAEKVGLVSEKLLYFSILWESAELYEYFKSRGISLSGDTKRWYVFNFSADDNTPIGSYRLAVKELGLELFDKHIKNKIKLLRYLIDNDAADCLAELENYGWFKAPKKRDELIQYASENGSRECAAWLLECKNRTADIAAERSAPDRGTDARPLPYHQNNRSVERSHYREIRFRRRGRGQRKFQRFLAAHGGHSARGLGNIRGHKSSRKRA